MSTFTMATPGAALPPARKPKPSHTRLGKTWRGWTSPGVYEAVKAVTSDGTWLFGRAEDGTWDAGHLPTETVVKSGLRSLGACRAYAGSGKAQEDFERIQAEGKESGNG